MRTKGSAVADPLPARSPPRPRAAPIAGLDIELSRDGEIALFVQIREQVRDLIQRGSLRPGMRLPPVRALARQLRVNQITVARAYRELVETGLVEGRRGGGSIVRAISPARPPALLSEPALSQPMLAERLYELARAPGVIAFSSNYPRPDASCLAEFRTCMFKVLDRHLATCLHYEPPAGRLELRTRIAQFMDHAGASVDASDIVVTSGAQQAIDLTVRAICQPGMPVAVEQPAYYGAINALRSVQARILGVPLKDDGVDLDALEACFRRGRARVLYTNPTFQNPTGVTMSLEKRQAVLALAARYGVIILEDDHSPELRFRGASLPSIRSLPGGEDRVVHVRSFGKVILPGIRLGFLVAPAHLLQRLLHVKANADLHCSGLLQLALAVFLERRKYSAILDRMRRSYGDRQTTLYTALKAGLAPDATLNRPDGGLSLWLTLPGSAGGSELYFRAVRRGVAFVEGSVFYAFEPGSRSLRLSFGLIDPDLLLEGVERLCSLVGDLQRRHRSTSFVMM